MTTYSFDRSLSSENELLDFFVDAIDYRNKHKDQSVYIALHVFDSTHPQLKLSFPISDEIDRLRDEFGAPEAPGAPIDNKQPYEEYEDEAWKYLFDLINIVKEKRTV